MKQKFIYSTILFLAIAMLSSCEKSISGYENDARVYFFERGTDLNQTRITTKSFSFLRLPLEVTKDTFLIKVKIMGETVGYDRVVLGKTVSEGTTAQEGVHYDFIDGIVPADSIIGYLPVVLYRTADIATQSVQLNLTIAETKDFKPGVASDINFNLQWSDNVVKPANWDAFIGLRTYFGTYSDVKWRFIIAVTGIDNFPLQQSGRVPPAPGEFTGAAMMDIALQLKAALTAYNQANDPDLTDEFGPVTFP
ncbi:MAG: DUF4843 domain-containing protein [Chitinophagaceae bacterium]